MSAKVPSKLALWLVVPCIDFGHITKWQGSLDFWLVLGVTIKTQCLVLAPLVRLLVGLAVRIPRFFPLCLLTLEAAVSFRLLCDYGVWRPRLGPVSSASVYQTAGCAPVLLCDAQCLTLVLPRVSRSIQPGSTNQSDIGPKTCTITAHTARFDRCRTFYLLNLNLPFLSRPYRSFLFPMCYPLLVLRTFQRFLRL